MRNFNPSYYSPEVEALYYREYKREDGHPDFEYSRRKFAELDIEERIRSSLIKDALDRMKVHYKRSSMPTNTRISIENKPFISEGKYHFEKRKTPKLSKEEISTPEARNSTYETPKTKPRRSIPIKKIIGVILAIVIIGAFLWFSPFLNLLQNNSFSPKNYSHEELVNYTLSLINYDRNGLVTNPNGTIHMWVLRIGEQYPQNVSLSSVGSAQQHADDMLKNHYFSHWDTNGYKPYVRYTLFGGNGSVAENIAWQSASSSFDAKEAIESLEWQMMEEDSQWDWGHRDNIIESFHNKVSIGIAYDSNNLYLVEDFEDDYIAWSTLTRSSIEVIMDGTIMKSGLSISNVAIYYDKIANLTAQQLANAPYSGSYGFGTFVGMAVPSGWQSPEGITITARTWSQTGQSFQIDFDLSPAFAQFGKGIYTLCLITESNEFLTSFSVWN